LAVFRITLGFSTWFEAHENVKRLTQYTAGQFHLRYAGLELDFTVDRLHALCEWQMRFAFAVILGLASRVFALLAFACQASLFLVSQLNFRNHVYLMLVLLVLLATTHSDRRWGLQALARRLRGGAPTPPTQVPVLGVRFIQAQVLIIYFYSGLHKLVLGFGGGYPLCRFLGREFPRGRSGDLLSAERLAWVSEHMSQEACLEAIPAFILVGSVGTIVVELGLAVALGFARSFWPAIIAGVGLHAVIFVSMDVVTFGLMMVASYPLFWAAPPFDAMREPGPSSLGDVPSDVEASAADDASPDPSDADNPSERSAGSAGSGGRVKRSGRRRARRPAGSSSRK